MKKIVLGVIIGAAALWLAPEAMAEVTVASEGDFEASVSADLVTSYVWRGQELGGFSVQPGVSIAYKGLSLSAWGSTSIEDKWNREVDFTLAYAVKGFTIGVTDYWFSRTGDGETARYFSYGAHNPYNSHVWEGHVGYDFGPLAIDWYTNFAGCDGVTHKGKRAYSSFVELTVPFSGLGLDWELKGGASPYCTSFYNANGFAVTEAALKAAKTVKLSEAITFPAWVQIAVNPRNSDIYLVAGVSF
ncbi:MAG: hypothetical protein LIP09_03895 [Bacteroidales bacterium]|nr:hypothetical protein [Bacteroidales bacterium]